MNFGERLFDELKAIDNGPDFETFCAGIGAMFQPVEDIAGDTEDGDIGYSILVDIDRVPNYAFGWLGQFIGVPLLPDLDDDAQRDWIRQAAPSKRGRPKSIAAAAQVTLTGTKTVIIRERDGSAWRYTVLTRPSETPDPVKTLEALKSQKPGPDILNYETLESIDYEWIKDNELSYAVLEADFSTYEDVKEAGL